MKRYLILALALLLALLLLACGGKTEPKPEPDPVANEPANEPAEKPADEAAEEPADTPAPTPDPLVKTLAGLWKATLIDMGNGPEDIAPTGFKVYLEFAEDSQEVTISARWPMPSMVGTCPYTIDEYRIGFQFGDDNKFWMGYSETGMSYDPTEDVILWLCPTGNKLTLNRAPGEQIPMPPTPAPTEEPFVLTEEAKPYVGTWVITGMVVEGKTYTAEELNIEMTLELFGDGVAKFYDASCKWRFEDGAVKLTDNGKAVYDLVDTDGKLLFHESQSGVDMIFEKQNEAN